MKNNTRLFPFGIIALIRGEVGCPGFPPHIVETFERLLSARWEQKKRDGEVEG